MPSNLELLIRARLDATGLNQLETQLSKISNVINTMMQGQTRAFNAADFIFSEGDVDSVRASVAEIDDIIQDLKGRIINAFATGGDGAVQQFEEQMKRLQSLRSTLQSVLPEETFDPSKFMFTPQSVNLVKTQINQLEKEIIDFNRASAAAFAVGEKAAGEYFSGLASKSNLAKTQLQKALSGSGQIFDPGMIAPTDADVSAVQGRINSLTKTIEEYKVRARAAYAENLDDVGDSFRNLARENEILKKNLESTIPVAEKSGDAIQKLLTNRITRLGFGIFAIQSSIQTFTSLVKGMFDTISEGAASLDRSRSFEILLTGEGIEPTAMAANLRQASQGLVTLDVAMSKVIQLAKAGFPDIARESDKLLRVATNAAIVSGDVSQATVIYEKLIRGIIRGSPRLIDDADIILKLGDANEKYAESLGKTVEELTAAEKVQATYNAVMQEGERINQLAEQVDSTSVKVAKLKTEWSEFTEILKESLAIVLVSTNSLNEMSEVAKVSSTIDFTKWRNNSAATAEDIAVLVNNLKSLKGVGVLIGSTFALAFRVIEESIARTGKNLEILIKGFGNFGATAVFAIDIVTAKLKGMDDQVALLNKRMEQVLGFNFEQYRGPIESLTSVLDKTTKDMNDIFEAAGLISGEKRQGISIETPEIDSAKETNEQLEKLLQERAKMAADIEYDRTNKIRDINEDHADKMADIAEDLADKLRDINQDLNDKLADLAQDRIDKLADIQQDLADKLIDIDQDLADKLSDIQNDSEEKRRDAIEDSAKEKEKIEEDYQKKVNDILRKYEASRLQALIDRDARALFEAQKNRDQDLKDAQETVEQKRKDELEELQEKLDDIAKAEEKARQDAIERQQQQREDAIRAAEQKRRDAQQAYERARRDAQQAAERQRRDAQQAADRARREAAQNLEQARRDAQQAYRDKLRDLALFHAEELGAYQNQYQTIANMSIDFYNSQLNAAAQFQNSFSDIIHNSEWTSVGSNIDPTTGNEFPDWRNPANVYPGGRCNRGSSQITTGADGRQYICVGNSWRIFDAGSLGSTSTTGISSIGGGAVTAGGNNKLKLEIVSNGDNTLQKILEGVSYDAFINILGE